MFSCFTIGTLSLFFVCAPTVTCTERNCMQIAAFKIANIPFVLVQEVEMLNEYFPCAKCIMATLSYSETNLW
uniref:Secreted protein n=1 Tax=Rhizophora mucronata TaxID=61149 RepID=A0A2P2R094_RHIMU